MSTALTMTKSELTALEKTVREGLQSFIEVGRALQEINERQGYRLRGFETFDDYCEGQFGFSRRHGYRMIAAAQTVNKVKSVLGEAPRNEAAARVLTPVAQDRRLLERVKVKLDKSGKTVATATAEQIGEAVKAVTSQKKAAPDAAQGVEPEKPKLPVLTDVCPHCKQRPESYHSRNGESPSLGGGWHCGLCDAPVMLGVIEARPAACPACGCAVIGDAGFCQNCGEVVA